MNTDMITDNADYTDIITEYIDNTDCADDSQYSFWINF